MKSLKPTLHLVGVSCVLVTAVTREGGLVCGAYGWRSMHPAVHTEFGPPPSSSEKHIDISKLFTDAGGLVVFLLTINATDTEEKALIHLKGCTDISARNTVYTVNPFIYIQPSKPFICQEL